MSDLTHLTLAEARDGLKNKSFSAAELADAHLKAIDEANPAINAYVLVTPEHARAQAKESDARIAKGEARPLEGLPLGNKDLFCTEGIRTTACSKILGDFYRASWENAGMETVTYETIEVGAPDANIPMRRIQQSNPDVIMDMTSSAAESANLYRARARLRDETVIFGNNALGGTPHIWEIAGTTLDGTLIVDFVSSSNPNTAALKEVYEAEHGENSFVGLHANVWDGLMLIKKAVETAGSTDGTAARDEFQKISDFPASFGQPGFRHHYSEERHNGTSMSAHIILQFKDGLPSVVWDVFQP